MEPPDKLMKDIIEKFGHFDADVIFENINDKILKSRYKKIRAELKKDLETHIFRKVWGESSIREREQIKENLENELKSPRSRSRHNKSDRIESDNDRSESDNDRSDNDRSSGDEYSSDDYSDSSSRSDNRRSRK